jgi:hypothetical protein
LARNLRVDEQASQRRTRAQSYNRIVEGRASYILICENPGMESSMTAHAVKLKVIASVPKDCSFWLEDDGWNGVCEELSLTVRGSSFEDAKTKMGGALQAKIESVLRKHSGKSGKRVA